MDTKTLEFTQSSTCTDDGQYLLHDPDGSAFNGTTVDSHAASCILLADSSLSQAAPSSIYAGADAYTGVPAPGFTNHVETFVNSTNYTPYQVSAEPGSSDFSSLATLSCKPQHVKSLAAQLADLGSELGVLTGATRGALGAFSFPQLNSQSIKATALKASSRLWNADTTALHSGVVGGVRGALIGYVLGYAIGDIAQLCTNVIASGISLLTGQDGDGGQLTNGIDKLKSKFIETPDSSTESATMQAWTSECTNNKARYYNDPSYRDTIDRGYIIIGTAAGEALLQQGLHIPSTDLQTPTYILKNTNYDFTSRALDYFFNSRTMADDDGSLPVSNKNELQSVSKRIDHDIAQILSSRHDMLAVVRELSNYANPNYDFVFDTWRHTIKENMNKEFGVSAKLQTEYKAKALRDLTLVDLALISNGASHAQDGTSYTDELHEALNSARTLDPNNEDLHQLEQLAVTLKA